MSTMSVGGLASGLDTNSIISSLVAIEQAKVTREEKKKTNAEDALSKFNDLETRLGNLQAKAKELAEAANFNTFKALSNYDEYATISGGEGATAGQYELVVYELATTHKVASNSFTAVNSPMSAHDGWAKDKDGNPVPESITITLSTSAATQSNDSTKKEVDIIINASDTLKDIVNKINAAEGTGVQASLMTMANGENRLILTSVDTGTAGFYMEEKEGTTFLQDVLGIIDYSQSQATSSNALLTKTGAADAGTTTFNEIDTGLGKNNFTTSDSFGIQIGDKWFTVSLYDSTKKDEDGNVVGGYRTIQEALDIINADIASYATEVEGDVTLAGLSFSLNNSGEIVLNGAYSNSNFDSENLKNISIQIGTLKDEDDEGYDENNPVFKTVKKDMGSLTIGNVFNENNEISKGQNAFYTIDGMAIGSQSNSDDGTIVGTTFTLKKADPTITIKTSLELDMDAIANKISELIEEFNSLLKFIDENSKATIKEEKDETTGKKTSTRETGVFTGDSNISSLRENLKRMLTGTINEITGVLDNGYSTTYSSASRIGIMTESDGYMSVDKEKLTKALKSDFEGVRKLFTTNSFSDTTGFSVGRSTKNSQVGVYEISFTDIDTPVVMLNGVKMDATLTGGNIISLQNGLSFEIPSGFAESYLDPDNENKQPAKITFSRGIASQLSNFVEQAKDSVSGYFKKSKETYQKRIDEIQKRVDQLQTRVDNYNTRLVNQYAALERALSTLQTQSSSLTYGLG